MKPTDQAERQETLEERVTKRMKKLNCNYNSFTRGKIAALTEVVIKLAAEIDRIQQKEKE